jgi:hypothetical protein
MDKSVIRSVVSSAALAMYISLPIPVSSAHAEARVEIERVLGWVVIRQTIVAGDNALVVPVCKLGCEEELCTLGVHIQVKSGSQWVSAPLSYEAGVPGGYPLDQAEVLSLGPGKSKQISFTFIRRDYVLKPGQAVRLRIDAWPSEAAFRANEPPMALFTPPFSVGGAS